MPTNSSYVKSRSVRARAADSINNEVLYGYQHF
jgi:hypothetical protein